MARPLKINGNFIKAARKVINEIRSIAWTDEDFLFEVNWELKPKDQISDRTFDNYIQRGKTGKVINETLKEFLRLLKKARHQAKDNLIKLVHEGKQNWQARAWILERKYPEYNLKQISEHKFDIQPITIKIDLNIKSIPKEKPKFKNSTQPIIFEEIIN